MTNTTIEKKTLVVFYSRTGNTRKIGREIAEALGADLEELVDEKKRKGAIGFIVSCFHAVLKRSTDLAPIQRDPGEYALVVIGTPVWANNIAPAIRTWLDQESKRLPAVAFFNTSGGGGNKGTVKALKELCGKEPVATVLIRESELKANAYSESLAAFTDALKA